MPRPVESSKFWIRLPMPSVLTAVALLFGCVEYVTGQAPVTEQPQASDDNSISRAKQASVALAAEADRFRIVIKSDSPSEEDLELTQTPKSLLRWSNTASGEIYGDVFLYLHNGIPLAIGSFHKWYSPHTHASFEFHSFAKQRLEGFQDARSRWQPPGSGIQWKPVPNGVDPADLAPQRLSQMRRIASQVRIQKTARDGQVGQLRRLTQPLYRFAEPDASTEKQPTTKETPWKDGAVFVFVQGTDPEAVLLLRTTDNATWEMALARLNSVQLEAYWQDTPVWTAEQMPWSIVKSPGSVYVSITGKRD